MSPRTAFALIMSLAYVAAGAALLFTRIVDRLIPEYRQAIGGVLLGYGILRSVIWWRKRRNARVG